MDSSSNLEENGEAVAGLIPLASVSQQPYVSELLSFTLDRLHKVSFFAAFLFILTQNYLDSDFLTLSCFDRNPNFSELMLRGSGARCRKLRWLIIALL